jgi:hypothetical protein
MKSPHANDAGAPAGDHPHSTKPAPNRAISSKDHPPCSNNGAPLGTRYDKLAIVYRAAVVSAHASSGDTPIRRHTRAAFRRSSTVAFVDQQAVEVNWETIKKVAVT